MTAEEQHADNGNSQGSEAYIEPDLARYHASQDVRILFHHGRIGRFISEAGTVVDGSEETFAAFLACRTHHHGTKRGAEHKGTDARQTYGRCQRQTELRVEDTGCSACKADRNEHSHEDERTGNDGHRHVAHRVLGRFVRTCVASIELRLHGFHNHDGVIHHRTDGKHQGKECQQVKRKAGQGQTGECSHQGYDNRYRGDEGRLEVLQEEVNHEYHQKDGNEQGLFDIRDGCQQEVVARHHLDELHAFWQVFAQFFQFGAYTVVRLLRVGSGQLEAEESDARMAISLSVEGVADSTEFHICDVLESEQRSVLVGTNHDVFELRDFFQTSLVLQGILVVVSDAVAMRSVHGFLAKLSGRRLQVLLCQGGRDVSRNDVVLCHQFGLHPDA